MMYFYDEILEMKENARERYIKCTFGTTAFHSFRGEFTALDNVVKILDREGFNYEHKRS